MDGGFEAKLRALLGEARPPVLLGVITEIEGFAGGVLATVQPQPDGPELQARLMVLASGDDRGFVVPAEVGEEVVVLCPGGDPNRAVALAGLNSSPAARPDSDTGDHVDLVHPGGLETRTTAAADVDHVVLAELLDGLQAQQNALQTFMTTASAATTAPQIAAAATTYLTAMAGNGFVAKLAQSIASGAPYRSTALKTE